MSDTLQEREDQMDDKSLDHRIKEHGLNPDNPFAGMVVLERESRQQQEDQKAWLECCQGYTHVPWCSKYEESKEYQRDMFPVGARVRAIAPVSRSKLGDDIPVGAWGTVSSHCDDGRAYIFFDGYDEGYTFHQPELSIRVVCSHQNDDQRCPANQTATTAHQPAARGGGDAKDLAPASALELAIKNNQIYGSDLSEHLLTAVQSLVAERERLITALQDCVQSLRRLPDIDGMWRRG